MNFREIYPSIGRLVDIIPVFEYLKMNFLSRHKILGLCVLPLAMISCVKNESDEPKMGSNDYITWNVVGTNAMQGRALIENNEMLQTACTGGQKAIGIWSAYEKDGELTKNVLGNPTGDVALIYQENTSWDNYNWWSYGENAEMWVSGATYTFNAYFPKNVV